MNYSVAVRTLGTAGEKYKKLIDSVAGLNPQPDQVIVVLPEGYSLPDYRLGFEQFVFCPKGMIRQRLEALNYITSEYTLFCDDDVEFSSSFVNKLYEPLQHGYSCSAGPLLEFFPPSGIKYFIASFLGGACVMLHGRDNTYTRILGTGGWSYNRSVDISSHKFYDAQSLAWTCFFIKTDVMRTIRFEDEMWVEKNGYAAFDDRVMFYKLLLNGYKSCVVSDAIYKHNDAKTSVAELKLEPIYAKAFNHYVFWHRFLYLQSAGIKKIWLYVCISYYVFLQEIYSYFKNRNKEVFKQVCKGFSDAKNYVLSKEYSELSNPIL